MTRKTRKQNSPPDEYKWRPGQSGNPSGRPKVPEEIKLFRKTTYKDFINALQKYGAMTLDEIKETIDDPACTMFDRLFATTVARAANGDKDARKEIFERLWGKPKEIDINVSITEIQKMATPELVIMAESMLKEMKANNTFLEAQVVNRPITDQITDSESRGH